MKNNLKTARTREPFLIEFKGYTILVPEGSIVSNNTACGPDDNYRFWTDYHKEAEKITGFKNSMLHHDLCYYGINVPADFCEPY